MSICLQKMTYLEIIIYLSIYTYHNSVFIALEVRYNEG